MFKANWNFIHRWGRACLSCSFPFVGPSLFCSECEKSLWRRQSRVLTRKISTKGLLVRGLFDWNPDQDRQVSQLILALKGGRALGTLEYFGHRFSPALSCSDGERSDTCLVPCPPKRAGALDHAGALAKVLSLKTGYPVREVLARELGASKQRTKGIQGRAKIHFQLKEQIGYKNVIFIDDVMTTGATAHAAREAMGYGSEMEVWVLAIRAELAGINCL